MEKTSILIVEDEFIIAKDIKMTLENIGYIVCAIVPSGEDAIKNTEKEKPDLVLMDIILKGTMDGVEAARQIRSLFNIPIVYLTAYADENMVERAKITEPFGYVIKPFNDRDLNSAIKIALYKHKVEKKLKESEERFRTLFEQANDSIFVHDLNGCFQDINSRACTSLGYTRDELLQMKVSDIDLDFIPRDDEKRFWDTLPVTFESRHHRKDGSCFPVEVHLSRIVLGKKCLVLSLVSDITERKRTAENEKFALVGQLAGRIAHDFNNMLGIIMGNTELALMDCKDEKTQKTLELIFEQTLRGKNLTKTLIAFARDQEPKQEFFKISEKINFVLSLLNKDLEEIELVREDKPDMPDLLGDPEMIEHALFNLVQNSIHALSMVEKPTIIIRTYCQSNNIYFEIQDNGCGIPEKYLKNICEPAFTLKESKDVKGSYKTDIKGAGYGLSNVKKYIEQHNGSILVESEFGSGSTFIISLPVIKKELTNEEKRKIRKETKYFEKYILVVEDETAIADVQCRILSQEPCNHQVDIAHNGQDAMALFKKNKYDLISLDYILPGKTNGMDVYKHIRKTDKNIPILFISGNIKFLDSIKELKKNDINLDHLSKPCQNKDYVNSINKLIERTISVP